MILGGLLLSYLNTFILLARPNVVICTLQRFTVGKFTSKNYNSLHNVIALFIVSGNYIVNIRII